MTTPTIGRQTVDACTTSTLEKTLRLIAGIVVTMSVLLGLYVHPNCAYVCACVA
jgi:hypothetical protein